MSRKFMLLNFFLFALLTFALKVPSLSLPLDNDSSAVSFFARHMLRGEILYDKFHTGHHLPAIYYTFVVAFKLFGDNPIAPKLLLIPFAIASVWMMFLIGVTFLDKATGILGTLFFALVSSQILFSGTSAQMEHFANLPLIATIFLFLLLLRRNASAVHFFWVGVLAALSVLYKIIFIGSLAAVGISMLSHAWMERHQASNRKKIALRLCAIGIGFALPLALVWGYFASMGLSQRITLIFTLGKMYFTDATNAYDLVFSRPFGFPFVVMTINNMPLFAFSVIGVYRLTRAAIPMRNIENLISFTLAIWAITSFSSTGLRGGGYEHYVLVALPPLALIGANEISCAYRRWKISSPQWAAIGAGVMSALIILQFAWINFALYRHYIPYEAKRLFQGYSAGPYIQDPLQDVAKYLVQRTSPDDLIYVWSNNMTLYYSTDRDPPLDIFWPEYVSATGAPQRIFNQRTKYILLDSILARPQWLMDGLFKDYVFEIRLSDMDIFRRKTSP